MTEPVSTFETIDEAADARAIARARGEIAAGKGVPHARVREWLLQLIEGKKTQPPSA